jgi:hypothetical protein
VKGTYILENDRTLCRVHAKALAPPWWESFHFRLVDVLKEESFRLKCDKLIIGAIYEHVLPAGGRRHPCAPQYIVAFRGTMLPHPKAIHDVLLDLKIIANTLQYSKRSQRAHGAVDMLLATINSSAVWLAGHSLGASLALEVGRTMMAEQGLSLPTFLFNPPHVSSAPLISKMLPSEGLRRELYAKSARVKAGLGLALSSHQKHMEELFERLSSWAPNLYVHDKDIICQGFVDYFVTSSSGSTWRSAASRPPRCRTGTCSSPRSARRKSGRTSCHPRRCGRTPPWTEKLRMGSSGPWPRTSSSSGGSRTASSA